MTTIGILALLFALILWPTLATSLWKKRAARQAGWRAYDGGHRRALLGTPSDPRMHVIEAHVRLAAASGNPEYAAQHLDEAAALYREVVADCCQPNVAIAWRRGADGFNAQARAIREHAKASS
jgi:hypothetical protein